MVSVILVRSRASCPPTQTVSHKAYACVNPKREALERIISRALLLPQTARARRLHARGGRGPPVAAPDTWAGAAGRSTPRHFAVHNQVNPPAPVALGAVRALAGEVRGDHVPAGLVHEAPGLALDVERLLDLGPANSRGEFLGGHIQEAR